MNTLLKFTSPFSGKDSRLTVVEFHIEREVTHAEVSKALNYHCYPGRKEGETEKMRENA